MRARVGHFFCEKLRLASHVGLPPHLSLELIGRDAPARESLLNVLQVLLCIQSDLDATRALAGSFHVVFVERHADNVLGA